VASASLLTLNYIDSINESIKKGHLMTISERTLRKWRKEALVDIKVSTPHLASPNEFKIHEISRRILQMTQKLLDQHLLRK